MNPNSVKARFLDWIKERTGSFHADLDPRAHGHDTWKGVSNEVRADEALAKVRNETGKEPDSSKQKTVKRPPPSWER